MLCDLNAALGRKVLTSVKRPVTWTTGEDNALLNCPFSPKVTTMALNRLRLCPIAALTAAWQNVVPREQFLHQPLEAAMASATKWISIARERGLNGLELAAALPLPDAYIDPATLLDPVASHLAVRSAKDGSGEDLSDQNAAALIKACGDDVKIFSLGAFENHLHPDPAIRAQVHAHTLRSARAARMLAPAGCAAVTTFIGYDWTKGMQENLDSVGFLLKPLWREFQKLGVRFRIENCPMPGWQADDHYYHNLGYCPAHWIAIFDMAKAAGVGEVVELNYDISHPLLMGSNVTLEFQALHAAGYGSKVASIHCKDQHRAMAKVALFTMHGQRTRMPHSWAAMIANHGMPGITHYNPEAMLAGRQADWVAHQLQLRLLGVDPSNVPVVIEHEWNDNRVQDEQRVAEMYELSAQYVRAADTMAEVHYQAPSWAAQYGIKVPGEPSGLFTPPAGLEEEIAAYRRPA